MSLIPCQLRVSSIVTTIQACRVQTDKVYLPFEHPDVSRSKRMHRFEDDHRGIYNNGSDIQFNV